MSIAIDHEKLPQEERQDSQRGWQIASGIAFALNVAAIILACGFFQATRPAFENIFDDFGAQLPAVTDFVVNLSGTVTIVAALAWILGLLALQMTWTNPWTRFGLNLASAVLLVLLAVVVWAALYFPYVALITNLSR